MYSIQKGFVPFVTGITSIVLPLWALISVSKYVLENVNTRIPEILGDSTKPIWLIVAMMYFFTMFFPVFFGLLLASIFPNVEIRRDGVNFRYWGFWGSNVKWEEIDSLVYYPNGYIILRIDKRGLSIFNGLYFNDLQGKVLKSQLPILVFSPGLEKREEIVAEILDKCSPRIVHRK
jgi:hypothetical protein